MSSFSLPVWQALALLLWNQTMGATLSTSCSRWQRLDDLAESSLFQAGDVVLGGLFNLRNQPVFQSMSYTQPPQQLQCVIFQARALRWAEAMVFAVEQINQDPFLLPGVTLGYWIQDSCGQHPWALKAALLLLSGENHTCGEAGSVPVIIGEASSTQSIILSRTLRPLGIPLISYLASCACLSNRHEYPNFFRTIPSDFYQARVMAQIVKRFGWTWVGAVAVNNDYGLLAIQAFSEEVKTEGVCLAFFEMLSKVHLEKDVARIARTMQRSSARVVLVFAWYTEVEALLLELARLNVTDRQFLASEAWSFSSITLQNSAFTEVARGTLGVAIRSAPIPGLEAHLRGVHPSQRPGNTLLRELWELSFRCSLKGNVSAQQPLPLCAGTETLQTVQNSFTDVSQLRITYNVYLAVYAVAHALHNLLSCTVESSPYVSPHCDPVYNVNARKLLKYLNQVRFTTELGEDFYFEDGSNQVVYDIVNWQDAPIGALHYVTVGRVDGSELLINESAIVWAAKSKTVPVSVCTVVCPVGTRKAIRKGEPICCFDCIPCADGEINNQTGAIQCDRCLPEFWSNSFKNECILREVEFISFADSVGITFTTVSLSGAAITVAVGGIFYYHRNTPLVKANNSELSFLLLLSLTLCFLCTLLFIGQPSGWSCLAQHFVFGVSFVLCLSCILIKTIVVLMAFRSARPGASTIKWFGQSQQRGSVLFFTSIQVAICAAWLTLSPPRPHRNLGLQGSKVILECTVGSALGFGCVLGYIGLLAAICFLLAFLARKLPDNFNEAKFITFSMLIFCAVWIAFVPAYVSTPGKYTVAVEIFAILASSFGLLFSIFSPKCYIILHRPEKNTKKFLMGKTSTYKLQ